MDTPQPRWTVHRKADLHRPNYLALLESASDGIFHVSADGALLEVSAKGRGMLGYAREEMPPLIVEDIIASEDAARVGPELARAQAGEIVHSEWRFRRRDGSRFQGEVHASALPDGGAVCVVRDITRLKDLQDLQLASTEAQRMAGMGSWEWTPATGAIHWSEGLNLIVRRNPVLPAPAFSALSQFYTRESWERLMAAEAKMMATGAPAEIELNMVRDDGTTCWTTMQAEAILGPDGSVVAVRGTVHDIDERKQAERAMQQQEKFTQAIIDTLPGLFYVVNESGSIVRRNKNLDDLSGYSGEEISRMSVLDFFKESEKGLVAERMQQVFVEGRAMVEGHFVYRDGRETPHLFNGERILFDGKPGLIGIGFDITERKRTEDALRASERKYRDLFDSTVDAIMIVDPSSGRFVSANPGAIALFATRDEDEFISHGPWNYSPEYQPDGRASTEGVREMIETAMREGFHRFEWMHKRADGTEFPADVLLSRVIHGEETLIYATVRDATERKHTEAQITRMARYDSLTGLANRRVFVDSLEQAIARARRNAISFAVLYLDLDHFKDVNDTLGHPIGDLLLQAVAERLQSRVREGDTVARFGGDEFAVILIDSKDPSDAAGVGDRIVNAIPGQNCAATAGDLADNILKAFNEPFRVRNNEIRSGASVGIAVYGPDSTDAETILSHADVALYRAKQEGRGAFRFFTDAMDVEVRTRFCLNTELREGIFSDQLFLVYQPQVAIDTGHVLGLEALVRWQHPTRGVVGPRHFIAEAERSGLIVPLERWVMREACRQIRQWLDAGISVPSVAINLSGIGFKMPLELGNAISSILADFRLPPRLLEFELTESVLMTASREHDELLVRLRDRGHRIAIDDFGTGYSSLDYLRRYPADRIKIAQSFIADIGIIPGNDAIVRAALGLARELGMEVVVEGVETAAQIELLRAWGCRIVQGHYFSKPLRASDVTVLLRNPRIGPKPADPVDFRGDLDWKSLSGASAHSFDGRLFREIDYGRAGIDPVLQPVPDLREFR